MTVRTRETAVTFTRPFRLSVFDHQQAAGIYRLVTDEEEIAGLSFLAYRRTATMLHIPEDTRLGRAHQVYLIDPAELADALAADTLSQAAMI
jgi:hypothetical protein